MILILGSVASSTSQYHASLGLPPSNLLESQQDLRPDTIFHTSLADCPTLPDFIENFDQVYWAESSIDEFDSFESYFSTIYLLKIHHNKFNNVKNIERIDFYNLKPKFIDIPNITTDHAIFLGCSHTYGVGLTDMSQSFTTKVANHFSKTPINLGMPGYGNFETFSNINRIDFLNNQLVVLQLTSIARILFYPNDDIDTMINWSPLHNIRNRQIHQWFNDKQLMYVTLDRLENVVKYLRSKNLRFVFFNLSDTPDLDASDDSAKFKQTIEYYLSDYQEYVPELIFDCCDRGTDNLHYGPETQQLWAKKLIDRLNKLYT